MGIKEIDYLSPKITLFFYGKRRHSSVFGGILTIIMIFVCILYLSVLLMYVCGHKILNITSYKQYSKNPGNIEFNNNGSGIFHYIQFLNKTNNEYSKYNKKFARIFMTTLPENYKITYEYLNMTDHWVYDECRKGIDDENIPQDTFNTKNNINNGACLRYYYNKTTKKYYSIEDKVNFIFPKLYNGPNSLDFFYLSTIVEKCHNDSILYNLLGPCETENNINNYFNDFIGIFLQLYETQVNFNYSYPLFNYINSIGVKIDADTEIPINNINLALLKIKLKTGIIIPKTSIYKKYTLDSNSKSTMFDNENKSYIITVFNYWLINNSQVFIAEYQSLYDLLSRVGGILQIGYYIFYVINFIVTEFTIMHDSKDLFFKSEDNAYTEKEQIKKNNFNSVLNSIREDLNKSFKSSNKKNNYSNINSENKMLENALPRLSKISGRYKIAPYPRIRNKTLKSVNKKQFKAIEEINNLSVAPLNIVVNNHNNYGNRKHNSLSFRNNIKNDAKFNNLDILKQNIVDQSQSIIHKRNLNINESININVNALNYEFFLQNFSKFISEKKQEFKLEELSVKYLEKYMSFFYYVISLFTSNKKQNKCFFILDKFRRRILSEEYLFKTNVLLYQLKRYFDIRYSKIIDIGELYN